MTDPNRIRELNDRFRHSFDAGLGRVLITSGVSALGLPFSVRAQTIVRVFDGFNEDNDPRHEHDFGSFELEGRKLYWKIDYYDRAMEHGSEDPSDPEKTMRVLTIMLAEEY